MSLLYRFKWKIHNLWKKWIVNGLCDFRNWANRNINGDPYQKYSNFGCYWSVICLILRVIFSIMIRLENSKHHLVWSMNWYPVHLKLCIFPSSHQFLNVFRVGLLTIFFPQIVPWLDYSLVKKEHFLRWTFLLSLQYNS